MKVAFMKCLVFGQAFFESRRFLHPAARIAALIFHTKGEFFLANGHLPIRIRHIAPVDHIITCLGFRFQAEFFDSTVAVSPVQPPEPAALLMSDIFPQLVPLAAP